MLRVVGLDVVAPLVVFQLARQIGVPVVWALVASGFPPLAGVIGDWIRWRTVEMVGVVVCAGIVLSVVLALVSNDPRVVLLEGVVVTFAFGVGCLWSLRAPRPLIFSFAQAFYGGPRAVEGAELDTEYVTYREARAFWRSVTVVWAAVYAVESIARGLAVMVTAPQTALLLNRLLPWVVYVGLTAWTFWWGQRVRGGKPEQAGTDQADG